MRKILVFLIFTYLNAIPNKNDFNYLFTQVAEKGSPCIVSIISEKIEKNSNMFFFGPFDFEDQFQNERKAHSLGSGVVFDSKKGYIITNNHVIENAE